MLLRSFSRSFSSLSPPSLIVRLFYFLHYYSILPIFHHFFSGSSWQILLLENHFFFSGNEQITERLEMLNFSANIQYYSLHHSVNHKRVVVDNWYEPPSLRVGDCCNHALLLGFVLFRFFVCLFVCLFDLKIQGLINQHSMIWLILHPSPCNLLFIASVKYLLGMHDFFFFCRPFSSARIHC